MLRACKHALGLGLLQGKAGHKEGSGGAGREAFLSFRGSAPQVGGGGLLQVRLCCKDLLVDLVVGHSGSIK